MLSIKFTSRFKRDYKAIKKRGFDETLLMDIIDLLARKQPLPERCVDHSLGGEYVNFRDCHILPDWILIYQIETETNTLYLIRTGSHSDLFG